MDKYLCAFCGKTTEGRFTRRKHESSQGWSQHLTLPRWTCWTCLPPGEGRGEDANTGAMMAPPKIAAPMAVTLSGDTQKKQKEVQRLIPTLTTEAEELEVTDADSYVYADEVLSKIISARKHWGSIWKVIQEKTIKPIRAGLDSLYEVDRTIDRPLEALEKSVKGKMKAFKEEEAKQLREAQAEKEREAQQLRDAAAKKALAESTAKTASMRERLRLQREELENQATEIEQAEPDRGLQVTGSSTRAPRKVRVVDIKAWVAALDEETLVELLTVNLTALNRRYKADPATVTEWPGIEEYDDIQIVGRS